MTDPVGGWLCDRCEPGHLLFEFGNGFGWKHECATVVNADRGQFLQLGSDGLRRANQIAHHLLRQIASGVGKRFSVRNEPGCQITGLGLGVGVIDRDRKLDGDFNVVR